MWKIQARERKKKETGYRNSAIKLQCWWRVLSATQLYIAKLRHHIEIIPDLVERRLFSRTVSLCLNASNHDSSRYYFNHNTGECTWIAPRHGAGVLHFPQDYVLAQDNDRVYFVRWSISPDKAHLRMWKKPPGYLRCTKCLQNIALLECNTIAGAYCFRCFRDTFEDRDFVRNNAKNQRRIFPIACSMCKQGRVAGWRRTNFAETSIAACTSCFARIGDGDGQWLRV